MQYQITQQVLARDWDEDKERVLEQLRMRAEHDLAAQNPGSVVTIESVNSNLGARASNSGSPAANDIYVVDVVVEYTISGQPNPLAS